MTKYNVFISVLIFVFLIFSPSCLLTAQTLKDVKSLLDSLKYEQAISLLDKLIQKDKKNPLWYHTKGKIYSMMDDNLGKYNSSGIEYRKQAEENFRKALKFDKENESVLNDLGIIKKEQGYITESERIFKKVIKIDELNSTAYSNLVDLYKKNDRKLEKIRISLIKTDLEYNSLESKLSLSKLYLNLNDYANAKIVLTDALKIDSTDFYIYKYFAEAHFNKKEYSEFTKKYYKYLERTNKTQELEHLYYEIVDIISQEQRDDYKSLPVNKKNEFLLEFWKNKDPNPMTVENERLVEHIKRIKHARMFYSSFLRSGYDERGRWYVKLGPPDNKVSEPMGGVTNVGLSVVLTPPNESWVYTSIDPSLDFDFLGTSAGYFKEVDYFPGAIGQAMHRDRANLSSFHAMLGTAADFKDTAEDLKFYKYEAKIRAEEKIDHYIPEFEFKTELTFNTGICQFKGKENETIIEVYYGLFSGELKPVFDTSTNYYTLSFDIEMFMQDSLKNEIYREKFNQESKFRSEQALKESISVDKKDISLENGDFDFYIQMIEKNSNTGNIQHMPLHVKDFSFDTLMVSDIRISNNIRKARSTDKYVKNGLNIFPYPFKEISRSKPLHIYYEIYNLSKNEQGRTDYEIAYNVKLEKRNESLLKKIFGGGSDLKESISFSTRRTGNTPDTFETTAFDLTKLKFGEYKLIVTIKDFVSEKSTGISDNFIVIE